ncbi:hypothetical protein JHD50_07170 [Sulfurimonas sp. MAG313]|nr:hypothetical protein [Sulfurimonas sp. MAG313]MDF1881086.1 hypothetical protein [Sulfurimonas sp. MAG313]
MSTKANTSSVEMDDGVKLAFQGRTRQKAYRGTTDPAEKQEAGKRKDTSASAKAKIKKKAKLAKASRKKNK